MKNLFVLFFAALTALVIGCATTKTATTTSTVTAVTPLALTDYTVHMDYIWGVVEERGKPPQVFIDDRIEILNIGPSEVSRKIMYVEARCRDAQDSRVERVWLTFRRNMEYTQVKWHHLRSSHAILAPLRDPILEGVRRGKDRPPMVMAEVRFD